MTKETKQYFTDNNHLNKGFAHEAYIDKVREEFNHLMPSPHILQAYEEIKPGTIDKLVQLMEKEQSQKHKIEDLKLAIQGRAIFVGRLFAVLNVCMIGYVTTELAKINLLYSAFFALLAFFSVFWISISKYRHNLAKNHQGQYDAKFKYESASTSKDKNDEAPKNVKKNWGDKNERNNHRKPVFKKKNANRA
jgi:uncharacterized membrane protein